MITIARVLEAALEVGRDQVAQVVVVLGVLGQQHPEPVADRDPGVTTRNRLAKRASRGDCTLLMVCQAMSIAITTVLPAPVAIFSADPRQPVVVSSFSGSSRRRQSASRGAGRRPRRGRSPSRPPRAGRRARGSRGPGRPSAGAACG